MHHPILPHSDNNAVKHVVHAADNVARTATVVAVVASVVVKVLGGR